METNSRDNQNVILQGNEACAKAAIYAGCRFFAGYPITPSTEIIEMMSAEMPACGGVFVQMEDEIASGCAITGARWGGKKAMTATSGPGFTLMQEALGFAAVTETPIVIVNVQRGGPATGQPTLSAQQDIYQARYGSHGDYEIIALAPSSVQEFYDFTVRAFELAERFRTPVILLADEIVGHMREKIVIKSGRAPERTELVSSISSPHTDFFQGAEILVEGQLHDEKGRRIGHVAQKSGEFIQKISRKIQDNVDEITDVESFYMEDADTAIVAYGSVARPAMDAARMARGIRDDRLRARFKFVEKAFRRGFPTEIFTAYSHLKVGVIKINTVWPFPEEKLQQLTKNVKLVIVPEMNMGKYCREVERALKDKIVRSMPKLGGDLHTPRELLDEILREVGKNE